MTDKFLVGGTEWCSLPALGIPHVEARVDSGAKTSAIHTTNIERVARDGQTFVRFDVHPLRKDRRTAVRCEALLVDRRTVKNTSGLSEKRYVVRTTLGLGEHAWEIELTLADRDAMGYRMLLGREAMSGRILVDPDESNLLGTVSDTEIHDAYHATESAGRSGLHIALLASNPSLFSNRRIIEAGEERGHKMSFLSLKQCYMKLDAVNPQVHTRGGKEVKDVDAVIPRIRPSMTFYGCALTRHFEAMGKFVLNSSTAIRQSRDKLFSLQLLLKKGLDIPTTGFANSPVDTQDLINMVGGAPLVVKLLEGTQGQGVVLAETRKAAESTISAFKSLNANLLVQEFIKEADGKDLRCFVIDGKVIATIQREAADGDFRANIHQGGSATAVRALPEERQLALRATKALGLQVAGVDIIRSKRGPLLLEVNSSPGLEAVEGASGKDIAGSMIASIERSLGWTRAATATTEA